MWSSNFIVLVILSLRRIDALFCYQCSMNYTNEECNSKNSTYATECQPAFDTCLTIVLKPAILNQLLITKYCTKRSACERQLNYTQSLVPCQPNNEGRSWGCVTCCGDRDLCNSDQSNALTPNWTTVLLLLLVIQQFGLRRFVSNGDDTCGIFS
ncbi:unnamed protein product [Adineta ricciae]|uniref:Uncharacterized protein n=1 Tax=Adineta ricciae TaxID=249248 RepID=A0A814NNM1_ADIRI|nr:unnamed protein product [Adineta ricciae]CAF1610062.1 unnamed protein product [Adineta ricciae]